MSDEPGVEPGATVAVVGAGPALEAVRHALVRRGLDVVVVDEAQVAVWAVEAGPGGVVLHLSEKGSPTGEVRAGRLVLAHATDHGADGRPRPASELGRSIGADSRFDEVAGGWVLNRDQRRRTSVVGVYVVGATAGVLSLAAARADAVVVADALAAAGRRWGVVPIVRAWWADLMAASSRWWSRRRWRAVDSRLAALPADTVVCPCEGLTLGDAVTVLDRDTGTVSLRDVKLATRLGMGACQGRACATLLARWAWQTGREDLGLEPLRPRPPVVPLTLTLTPEPLNSEPLTPEPEPPSGQRSPT